MAENDFERYIANVMDGPNQRDLSNTFEGVRERIKLMGGNLMSALAMAMFFFDPQACRVSNDEMRRAWFLRSDRDWRNLQVMKRRGLVIFFNIIKVTKPWPQVWDEVTLHPEGGSFIRMVLVEIDIGNRNLNMLLALCERKNKARFSRSPRAKLARGVYDAVGSLMLTIRDPGGVALEDPRSGIDPAQGSGAGSSTLAQEPAASVHADDSEAESGHSSDPGDLRKKSRKEACFFAN
jgi:hypothetical protein